MEPIRGDDSDDLFEAVVSQDGVMRWLATGRADSRSAAEAMCDDHVAHWFRPGYGDFAVRDAATRAFLGRVGLRNRARYGVDLGFALHPRAQGRGIASEAGRACLDLGFRRLALPVMFAFVLADNAASIALLRRLGAQPDGTVLSSGRHCLRYRFDPAAEPAVDGEHADPRLGYAPGAADQEDYDAIGDGLPDPLGVGGLDLVRADLEHTLTAFRDGQPVASLGRGIARTVISVAVEHARAAGAETIVLLCRAELLPLYEQLGWRRLSVPVSIRQADGARSWALTTMTYDVADLPPPTVGVDLQGLPF